MAYAHSASGSIGDDETKCLLTPSVFQGSRSFSFMKSESDLHNPNNSGDTPTLRPLYSAPIIYSEPTLLDAELRGCTNYVFTGALSETALPFILQQQEMAEHEAAQNNITDETQSVQDYYVNNGKKFSVSRNYTPKSSMYFSDTQSQKSVATNMGSTIFGPKHKQSFSTTEIREQHMQIQKKYRNNATANKKNGSDPIDFEGVLSIIGGCTWWQIWVYLLISMQQIPHAMFNLNVVYMMYQPDHWCLVPGTVNISTNGTDYLWSYKDAMNYSIIYPITGNKQRDVSSFHDQCHYYDRDEKRYDELRRMTLEQAQEAVKNEPASIRRCEKWSYADDVMKSTIVTEWNLVCDDNFQRAHAHLAYSVGFLFGCLLGGFASDRWGRKPTIIGFGVLSSMFGLILPYSIYFPLFLVLRFLGAVCNEAADLAAYILCMEITGMHYRAMVGSLLQAPWAVGYALLALIAYFCKSWQSIQLICALMHAGSICLICVLPESPRWLIVNNRLVEAERHIRKACRDPPFPFNKFKFAKSSLPCDLELKRHSERAKWVKDNQRANIFHLLKSRQLSLRTVIISTIWIATALVYYGLVIALSDQSAPGRVLFSGNFFVNNAIAGAIEIPTLFFCVYLMKFGRKRSQMVTLIGASICILGAMIAMNSKSQAISLVLFLLSKIFIQGAFNVLYIFSSEMYPTVIRNTAVGFNSMIARFGSGISSYIAILSDVTLPIVPMIIFAIFSLFAGVLVLLLPETKDQPLPDTLEDAVKLIQTEPRFQCYGFGAGKYSLSLLGDDKTESNGDLISGNTRTNSRVDNDDETTPTTNNVLTIGDSTSMLSRRRSETFTELPIIFEQPSSAENTITSQNRPEALRTLSVGPNLTAAAIALGKSDDDSEPKHPRERHAAGTGHRKVSGPFITEMTKQDSLLHDLEEIDRDPAKLTEPFDDD